MLYVTTRSRSDAFTAFRALSEERAPDRGLFVPFQIPHLDELEITQLREKSFSQAVADILNLFFNARLDSWDIDFCIGRHPTRLIPMSHKIIIAEMWRNPDYDFCRIVRNLASRILGKEDVTGLATDWAWIAVRIAFLFGLFANLHQVDTVTGTRKIDIALPAGDFSGPMAVWYAREMGLPIGNIICSCQEPDPLWDLLHHGELSSTGKVRIPLGLERLISAVLGMEEAVHFASCVENGKLYSLKDEQRSMLEKGLFTAVISSSRKESIIRRVYQNGTYILEPDSATAYGGLQDCRASCGESSTALLLADRSPICAAQYVAEAIGVTVTELKRRLQLS